MKELPLIKGVTFAAFAHKGCLDSDETKFSLNELAVRTGANLITLIPNGLQETAQSEEICYTSPATMTDDELLRTIDRAHEKKLMVALKPTANCMNGTWRAHISFFDKDVVCEPKWSNWFKSYNDFQMHYAELAQKSGCEMFIPGCEMVMSEHREVEWRALIKNIRTVYKGPVSYNTDKYQEDNITWWDEVDYISSSGYYPINEFNNNLDRIERVVKQFKKPFFFAEAGCMAMTGASLVPNDWHVRGPLNLGEQNAWYKTLFTESSKRDWVKGFCTWDWSWKLYPLDKADEDAFYGIYGKPAEKTMKEFYTHWN